MTTEAVENVGQGIARREQITAEGFRYRLGQPLVKSDGFLHGRQSRG